MILEFPEDVETKTFRRWEEERRKRQAENPYYPYVWGQKA